MACNSCQHFGTTWLLRGHLEPLPAACQVLPLPRHIYSRQKHMLQTLCHCPHCCCTGALAQHRVYRETCLHRKIAPRAMVPPLLGAACLKNTPMKPRNPRNSAQAPPECQSHPANIRPRGSQTFLRTGLFPVLGANPHPLRAPGAPLRRAVNTFSLGTWLAGTTVKKSSSGIGLLGA